jgi:hypothetical protein
LAYLAAVQSFPILLLCGKLRVNCVQASCLYQNAAKTPCFPHRCTDPRGSLDSYN